MKVEAHIELGKLALELGFLTLDVLSRALVELGQSPDKSPSPEEFWHRRGYLSSENLAITLAYRDTQQVGEGNPGTSPPRLNLHGKQTREVLSPPPNTDALAHTAHAGRSESARGAGGWSDTARSQAWPSVPATAGRSSARGTAQRAAPRRATPVPRSRAACAAWLRGRGRIVRVPNGIQLT